MVETPHPVVLHAQRFPNAVAHVLRHRDAAEGARKSESEQKGVTGPVFESDSRTLAKPELQDLLLQMVRVVEAAELDMTNLSVKCKYVTCA